MSLSFYYQKEFFYHRTWHVIKIILFYLLFFFIARMAFLLQYAPEKVFFNASILKAFFIGLRFDLSTILILSSPVLLLYYLPIKNKGYRVTLSMLSFTIFILAFFYLIVDHLYFAEANKRIGFEINTIINDMGSMVFLGINQYGGFILSFLLVSAFLFFLWHKIINIPRLAPYFARFGMKSFIFILLFILATITGIRGGFQSRPLSPIMAFQNENMFLGYLALNGIYTSLAAWYKADSLPQPEDDISRFRQMTRSLISMPGKEHFPDDSYIFKREMKNNKPQNYNVVIIILESWGYNDLGVSGNRANATPFFDKLSKESMLFENFFSVGQRTIPVLPSVISSIPTLFGQTYTTSSFQYNRQRGMGTILKEKGYETNLVYAAKPGSMGFSHYARLAGIDNVYTMSDFEGKPSDGVWGIFDEHAFDRLHELNVNTEKPTLSILLTLHPHPPYNVPNEVVYLDKEIHNFPFYNDMRYVDNQLEKYFAKVKASSYYKNTIFFVLADHAYIDKKGIELFHVPLLVHNPSLVKPGRSLKVGSHLDILPSIIDLLNINTMHSSMGKSLFSDSPSWAIVDFDNLIGYIEGDFVLTMGREKVHGLYNRSSDSALEYNLINQPGTSYINEMMTDRARNLVSAMSYSITRNLITP